MPHTHGMYLTREYACWRNMISRCTLECADKAGRYLGRGITVCDRWLNSFEDFYDDMGPRPSDKHSIERIENDVGYQPGNCVWAVKKQQCRNRKTSKMIEHNGEVRSLAEWVEILGLNYKTVFRRLSVGHSFADAIAMPVRHNSRFHGPRS